MPRTFALGTWTRARKAATQAAMWSPSNLEPGQKYTVNTFATHPWVFTDGPGNCIEMWVAQPSVSKFVITAKSSGKGGD